MEFIEKYALLITTIILSLVVVVIVVWECFQKNKLQKGRLTLSLINIFVLVLCGIFYEKIIFNETIKIIFYSYVLLIFAMFSAICLLTINGSNQKRNDYMQFINSLNKTEWNVYFVCDRKDRFKEISDSLLTDLGLTKDKVIGRKAFDVFDQTIRFTHVNDIELTNKELREYYKTFSKTTKLNEEFKREVYFKNCNGQTIVLNLVEKPIYIGGKYCGRLNIGQKKTDASLAGVERELVSKNKDLQSIQHKFIAALELTSEGIFFNDLDENYIWGNDIFVKELKISSNTIAYLSYRELIHPEDLAVYTEAIKNLTPERPTYSLTYRINIGNKYSFVKECGKRIFDDPNSNIILGFTQVVNAAGFAKTNMPEVDSAKGIEELMVEMNSLFNDKRLFQLVCINLTTLPDINNRNGRGVGNMIMNEYLKRLKANFLNENSCLYRASGLVFYFIITDTRKMEFLRRGLQSDSNSMNLSMNFGAMHADLKVNIGVAEAITDGLNKDELIRNCNAAINTSLNPNYSLNYAYFKDVKNSGIR